MHGYLVGLDEVAAGIHSHVVLLYVFRTAHHFLLIHSNFITIYKFNIFVPIVSHQQKLLFHDG